MVDRSTGKSPDEASRASVPDAGAAASGRRTVVCEVFRSPRREGMYLYVERTEGLKRVPEALLQRFGAPESALVFRLHGERHLARASAADVLEALADQGFYLQMPPVPGADAGDGAGQSAVASGMPDSAAASTDREDPSC